MTNKPRFSWGFFVHMKPHMRKSLYASHDQLEARPLGKSMRPLRAIAPLIKPYKGTLALAIVVLLAASAVTGSLPIAARFLIDNGIATGNVEKIDFYFKLVLGSLSASAFCQHCVCT